MEKELQPKIVRDGLFLQLFLCLSLVSVFVSKLWSMIALEFEFPLHDGYCKSIVPAEFIRPQEKHSVWLLIHQNLWRCRHWETRFQKKKKKILI